MKSKKQIFIGCFALSTIILPSLCLASCGINRAFFPSIEFKKSLKDSSSNWTARHVFFEGTENSFDFLYNQESKTGEIIKIFINDNSFLLHDVTRKITIPATCKILDHTGKVNEYKITGLNCQGNVISEKKPEGHEQDYTNIIIDLSKAYNLEYISKQCFKREDDIPGWNFDVQGIDFSGAYNLSVIDDEAFMGNMFTSQIIKFYDLTNTSLTKIGKMAFFNCNYEPRSHNYEYFSFPTSLVSIGEDAFNAGGEKSEDRIKFFANKIYFNTSSPSDGLISNKSCLPNIPSGAKNVVVPAGTRNKYLSLQNHIQDKSNYKDESYYESEIGWNSICPGGNRTIVAEIGKTGSDNKDWTTYNFVSKTKSSKTDFGVICSNDLKDLIKIDNTTRKVVWSEKLPVGNYKFCVFGTYKNSETGNESICFSEQISLSVVTPKLDGGSEVLYASENDSHDNKYWSFNIGEFNPLIETVEYNLALPNELAGIFSLETFGVGHLTQCCIKWNNLDNVREGVYKLKLDATATCTSGFNLSSSKNIALIVTSEPVKIELVDDNKQPTTLINLKANEIKTYYLQVFFSRAPVEQVLYSSINDENCLKVEQYKAISGGIEYPLTIKSGDGGLGKEDNGFKPGVYEFFMYFERSEEIKSQKLRIPLYSQNIKIVVGTDKPGYEFINNFKLSGGSDTLSVTKKASGKDNNKWTVNGIDLSKWKLIKDNSYFKESSWSGSGGVAKANELMLDIGSENSEFVVKWSDKLFTQPNWIDIFDCNLTLKFVNENDANSIIYLTTPLTFTALNFSQLVSDSPKILNVIPDKSGQSDYLWTLIINDDKKLSNGNFNYYAEAEDLPEDSVYFELDESKRFGILKWKNLSRGPHYIHLYATNDEYFVVAENTILLNVEDQAEIKGVTKNIKIKKGHAGSISSPMTMYVNGDIAQNAEYSIINAPNGLTIDKVTGIISWKKNIELGTHKLIIKSTASLNNEEISAYTEIIVNVEQDSVKQTWKYIGVGLGVGLGAAALASGITIVSRKALNKKKKNK